MAAHVAHPRHAESLLEHVAVGEHPVTDQRAVLIEVLDILRRYFYSQLTDTVSMLEEVGQGEQAKK